MTVSREQIISINIGAYDSALAAGYAKNCEVGGRSSIRDGEARQSNLPEDQFIGQLGTCVGIRALFGDRRLYRLSRWFADLDPTRGDGGSDVPGANIDIKTSKMRGSDNPLGYNLAVRPKERHKDTVYVLVLIECRTEPAIVYLVGWLADRELPALPASAGTFAGAFTVPATNLHPIMPIRWYC